MAPLFALVRPDHLPLTKSAGVQDAWGKESPLKAIILKRKLLSSIVLSLFFTLFSYFRKLGLEDLLVRLINKLYSTQYYKFDVYAWMFL